MYYIYFTITLEKVKYFWLISNNLHYASCCNIISCIIVFAEAIFNDAASACRGVYKLAISYIYTNVIYASVASV